MAAQFTVRVAKVTRACDHIGFPARCKERTVRGDMGGARECMGQI